MNPRNSTIAAVALAALYGVPASAELVDATAPGTLVEVIQALGYRAKLDTDALGDPKIVSSVGGTDFSIYFYGCTENSACKALLFKVGYDLIDGTTLEVVNDWNETSLFGRAYLDEEGDPWVEMAVNMDGGVARFNFEDTFDWWEVVVGQFETHIDF